MTENQTEKRYDDVVSVITTLTLEYNGDQMTQYPMCISSVSMTTNQIPDQSKPSVVVSEFVTFIVSKSARTLIDFS